MSFFGLVLFIFGILAGAIKDWVNMIFCNIGFICSISVLEFSILIFNIENCFKQLEAFVKDHNNKKESATYPKVMIPLTSGMMVFCSIIGPILCFITGLQHNWLLMSVFLLITIVIISSHAMILLLMKFDILRKHLETTIINTLEEKNKSGKSGMIY